MIRNLPHRTVVIVGGGLAAGLVARQLTSAGIEVVVLERGGTRDRDGVFPAQRDELTWDTRQRAMQDWASETYTLRHAPDQASAPIRSMEAFLPGNGLGGAATNWNGITLRWSEYEMEMRSHVERRYGRAAIAADMPLQDWGVTYRELEPYHHQFEKLFGVSGKAGNINGAIQPGGNPFEAPRRDEYPQPPLEPTEAGLIFGAAAREAGYTPFPLPGATSPRPYTNPDGQALGQCRYCGHCERFVCDVNAKATPHVLLYPLLRTRKTFEVRLQARVTRLVYDAAGKRIIGVRYVDAQGDEVEQPADVVVLAAYTLSNVKLLLTSRIGTPYDPARATGVVGKNLCYQTVSWVQLFFPNRWINPFFSSGSTAVSIDDLDNDNFDHGGLGFLGGALVSGAMFSGLPIRNRRLPPGTPRWGTAWKRANRDWYAHAFALSAWGSCYPHRDNYLDLDPDYTDELGLPLLRMTFDFRPNELAMSAYVTRKLEELAKLTGAAIVGTATPRQRPFDTRLYQSTHVTGGAIMGADPATSVVSPRLQHWDADNLFVVGASAYPHNSGHNPTGPTAALALRLGDDLVRYVQRPGRLT